MYKYLLIPFSIIILSGCMKGQKADLVIHNAIIHIMDENETQYEAIAIKDGKILEVGPERQILNKYSSDETIDAEGKEMYPGFTDAHGHLMPYADMKLGANLFGCRTLEELLVRTEKYADKSNRKFIVGHGWDQSMWGGDILPTNEKLNELFPNTPVCLYRVDGHAVLVNQAALDKAKITNKSIIPGGQVTVENRVCTGLLLDNAMDSMSAVIPAYPEKNRINALMEIQEELFQYGITSVHDAGIANKDLPLFKKVAESKELKLNVYGMLRNSAENKTFVEKNGKVNWGNFYISSFKMFADGALGSRGALLKKPYSDAHNHLGIQTTTPEDMNNLAHFCLKHGYQLNTHAIGDSSNAILLNLYEKAYAVNQDHRWRIEHAQVVDPADFELFRKYNVLPSVQPTHAISDMRWVENRLGKDRMQGAYAYQSILKETGIIAIGTDFPFDRLNPFLTIFAATQRKNTDNQPSGGFRLEDGLSLMDCIRGMTIWAAIASFQEKYSGTLEKGKEANLILVERPLNSGRSFRENFSMLTVIKGEIVYRID
ncbi:MAG: amidohydrolase [Crocinitomicaceae bacterium]